MKVVYADEAAVDKTNSKKCILKMLNETEKTRLGLLKSSVALAAHHTEWGEAFCNERRRLADIITSDEYLIEHVGSTSVKGLPAKPVLDIALLLKQPKLLSTVEKALCSNGYIYRGNKAEEGGHLFVFETSRDVRTIHLHAIVEGDPQWNAYLSFRDIMRANAELRAEYGRLKARLATEHSNDRGSYTAAKAGFIQEVLSMQERDRLKS